MDANFIISQILVGAALVCNLLSFQFKNRTGVVILLTLSTVFVAGQLYYLDQLTAAYLTLFAIIYWIAAIFTTDKRVGVFFLAAGAALFFYLYSSPLDLIVGASGVVTIISLFNTDQKLMRQLQMVGTWIRIPYYILVFSPVGILLEAALFLSNAVGYYRFYIKGAREQ